MSYSLPLIARIAFWCCTLIGTSYSLFLAPPSPPIGGDIALHSLGYAGLTVLGMSGWPHRSGAAILFAVIALGLALEGLQALHPARAFEASDIAANIAGASLAFALVAGFRYLNHAARL